MQVLQYKNIILLSFGLCFAYIWYMLSWFSSLLYNVLLKIQFSLSHDSYCYVHVFIYQAYDLCLCFSMKIWLLIRLSRSHSKVLWSRREKLEEETGGKLEGKNRRRNGRKKQETNWRDHQEGDWREKREGETGERNGRGVTRLASITWRYPCSRHKVHVMRPLTSIWPYVPHLLTCEQSFAASSVIDWSLP